jgi:hypothetical protein
MTWKFAGRAPPRPPPTGFIPVGANVEWERPGRITRKAKPVDANGDIA